MAKLVCQTGPKAGHEYPLSKDLTIMGRQSSCDVQIFDNMSSRAHCQVRRDGKLFSLVDLGSRNGTYLNDKKVSERQLAFGDRIRIGEAEYKLVKEAGDVELKDLLSKYEVLEKIGEGGMGIVYKANQKSMNRIVALKILSPKYSSKDRFVTQFIKEARAAGALNHPNIIQVHDVGTENGIHYFSMELIEGATCMQILKEQGVFQIGEALEIIRQIAKALEYAHSQRLIHQDIKPDNIMIGGNNLVKLADLGISKTFDEVESEEGPKRVMGTPHYMAPEAALGKKIDHRVDIYALGATLYQLLTGKTPYSGTSATDVLKAQVMDPLPAIEDLNPNVPQDICGLVERMLAKKADDRYQTAAEVSEEIQRLQQGHGLSTARLGGGETMLLRRYVGGDKPGGNKANGDNATDQTPGNITHTRTPRATDGGLTTAERIIGQGANNGMVTGIVVSLIILVLVIVGWSVLGSTPVSERPSTPKPNTAPINPISSTNESAEELANKRHASALTSLEDRLKTGGEQADLSALLAQIDELRTQKLSDRNKIRAKALSERIDATLKQRQTRTIEQNFGTLRAEIEKLRTEHNYELALKRLAAFAAKDDPAITGKLAALGDDVTKARDAYLSNIKQRIKFALTQEDLVKLKDLRDTLPPALLDTDIETEITKAMQTIESKKQDEQLIIVKNAAAALAKWDFAAVGDFARNHRAAMGATANGRTLDSYVEAIDKLKSMLTSIGTQLQKDGKRRYRGTLKGWTDPDLSSADANSLQLQVPGGGIASIAWSELPADSLKSIAQFLLTKDDAERALSAIDVWATTIPTKSGDSGK
jgi:serine/threonine protein kinase